MDNFREVLEGTFSLIFSRSSLNFAHNFLLESQNYKITLEIKLSLIYQIFLVQSFLKKVILLCLNEV